MSEQPRARGPMHHLSVDQVHELVALYEADKREYETIEARLGFKGPPTLDELGGFDLVEFDRRERLIEAYGRPAHHAYADALRQFSAAAITELIALAWLGRGDGDDFEALCAYQRT